MHEANCEAIYAVMPLHVATENLELPPVPVACWPFNECRLTFIRRAP